MERASLLDQTAWRFVGEISVANMESRPVAYALRLRTGDGEDLPDYRLLGY